MSLGLLAPLALLALAALLLPVLLHLDRRTEARPVSFAALQWLSARLRPRRRLRLREWLLLLLRLLLVAVLALLLARPVLFGAGERTSWVLLAPGVDLDAARAAVGDGPAQWRWLAPDFPRIDAADPPRRPITGDASLSSLLREADARVPSGVRIAVVLPAQVEGLDAERPRLSRRLGWYVVEGVLPPVAITSLPTPALFVRAAPSRQEALRFLRAASVAWQTTTPAGVALPASTLRIDIGAADDRLPANARWAAWLVPGPVPPAVLAWVASGGQLLLDHQAVAPDAGRAVPVWRAADGSVLAQAHRHGSGRLIQWRQPMTAAAMPALLEADFPRRLHELLSPQSDPPARGTASALRPVTGASAYAEAAQTLEPWIIWLALLLLAAERWLASARNRSP